MSVKLTAYQEEFKKNLPAEYQTQFDEVITLAGKSADVATFVKGLPEGFKEILKNATTVEGAVNAVFEASDWGAQEYAPPKAVTPKKAAKPAIKAPATPPAAGTTTADAPTKRKGNPEALRKAREARGLKNPEQIAADKATVIAAVKTYLTGKDVVHVKVIVIDLVAALKAKGSDGKDLSESFIYTTLTDAAKDPAAGFVRSDMEKRQIGYKLA